MSCACNAVRWARMFARGVFSSCAIVVKKSSRVRSRLLMRVISCSTSTTSVIVPSAARSVEAFDALCRSIEIIKIIDCYIVEFPPHAEKNLSCLTVTEGDMTIICRDQQDTGGQPGEKHFQASVFQF